MADPLIQYLLSQQMQNAKENPFVTGAQQIQSLPVYDKRFSTGNNIAAGALQGLASGLLGGYGRHEVDQQNTQNYKDLTNALATGDFSASPDLANIGMVYKLQQAEEDKKAALAQALLKQKAKNQPPKLVNMIDGENTVQALMDPMTGDIVKTLGKGPRYKFSSNASSNGKGDGNQTIADLIPSLGLSPDEEESAKAAIAAAASPREARMLYNSLQRGSIEKERRENRPITPEQTSKISSMSDFKDLIDEASKYAADISDSRLSRIAKSKVDSNSPDFKLNGVMSAAQQAFARARDSGALSRNDIEIYNKLFGDFGVLDSKQSLIDRINKAKERASKSYLNNLSSMKSAGFNVKNFLPEDSQDFSVTLSPEQANKLPAITGSEEDFKKAITKVAGAVSGGDSIETRTLKDGTTIKVRRLPNGKYEEVQ